MSVSENTAEDICFDERVKTDDVQITGYLGRIELRTHRPDDTSYLARIFSDPYSRRHLKFLQPPNGWKIEGKWSDEDFLDRVRVQRETRSNGRSCVLNIILLGEIPHCIGTTGYVTIDGSTGFLGIILDAAQTRIGIATEALHGAIEFAFGRLGVKKIFIQTDEKNEEMRGWCEKVAQLQVDFQNPLNINGISFIQYNYSFTFDDWKHSVKSRLEEKLDRIKQNLTIK